MKNNLFLKICRITTIIISFVILCLLLSSCNSNGGTRVINNKAELAELLMVDFTGLEITWIISFEFYVYVFCKGADDALDSVLGYDNFIEYPLEIMTPAGDRMLQMFGLTRDNVQRFAVKYRLRDRVPDLDNDWETHWYQLDRNHPNEGNILLYAYFPYKIKINVDAILAE